MMISPSFSNKESVQREICEKEISKKRLNKTVWLVLREQSSMLPDV